MNVCTTKCRRNRFNLDFFWIRSIKSYRGVHVCVDKWALTNLLNFRKEQEKVYLCSMHVYNYKYTYIYMHASCIYYICGHIYYIVYSWHQMVKNHRLTPGIRPFWCILLPRSIHVCLFWSIYVIQFSSIYIQKYQ